MSFDLDFPETDHQGLREIMFRNKAFILKYKNNQVTVP